MSARGGLTAEELIASLRRRRAALPSEIGTFVVFEACEAVLASGPVIVLGSSVRIDTEGGVSLLPGGQAADDARSARSVHALLTSVLLNARPAPPPRLMQLVEGGPSSGQWSLAALRDDLEANLVPLNRQASRRVLSRLLREAAADRMRGAAAHGRRSFDELDAELADLLGEDPPVSRREPAQRSAPPQRPSPPVQRFDDPSPARSRETELEVAVPGPEAPSPEPAAPSGPFPAAQITTDRLEDLGSALRESAHPGGERSRAGLWLGLGLAALAAGLVLAVVMVRPDVLARLRGEQVEAPVPEPDPLAAAGRELARGGELVVEVKPAGSQVLLHVGTAPVEISGVPVGQAQEFVATAEGRRPSRAVIAPGDTWEKGEDGPFFELAMQTRPLEPGLSARLGDSLLPMEPGTGHRNDGRVRVVTAPRGAQVYRVVGFAPEVRIQNLDIQKEHTLLVHRDGYEPREVHIRAQDWPVSASPVLRERVELKR